MDLTVAGNVGSVDTGSTDKSNFISFNLAEDFSYFDENTNEWVSKGVKWHECIIWIQKNNQKKFDRLTKFIVVGAGLLVSGRTAIKPSDETDEKGNPKYLNEHIVVKKLGLTTERLEEVNYKPKASSENV